MISPTLPVPGIRPASTIANFGEHLRVWRQRRGLSQLELAGAADISARHLSFVETGRTNPSREMVLRLISRLGVPLRERNTLLVAAGYAPVYSEGRLDDQALGAARKTIELILKGHEPFPALAIDRHWNMVAANRMVPHLLARMDASMTQATHNGPSSTAASERSNRKFSTRKRGQDAPGVRFDSRMR
jgi:transcriptional regulator with XRE-family HTH domain